MGIDGVTAAFMVEGSVDGEVFKRLPRNPYAANQSVMCRSWLVLGGSSLSLEIDSL
jgi:hypothetical protein